MGPWPGGALSFAFSEALEARLSLVFFSSLEPSRSDLALVQIVPPTGQTHRTINTRVTVIVGCQWYFQRRHQKHHTLSEVSQLQLGWLCPRKLGLHWRTLLPSLPLPPPEKPSGCHFPRKLSATAPFNCLEPQVQWRTVLAPRFVLLAETWPQSQGALGVVLQSWTRTEDLASSPVHSASLCSCSPAGTQGFGSRPRLWRKLNWIRHGRWRIHRTSIQNSEPQKTCGGDPHPCNGS
ncbi:uncharacterized protein LOC120584638 [Pteropus medius]|uniref:uncharacterized protein LOC120584638 n=1 Tax=Pteropus vampyrus TaxID=132908 RepID=UPI00196B8C4B|nr:uncharacterized protein LOC120584638 [Pteropus giganteus]